MATVHKIASGSWRVQVRRKGQYASNVFRLKADADAWVRDTESRIDRGENISLGKPTNQVTLGDLIDLHLADLKLARKVPGRSKQYTLDDLRRRIGRLTLAELTADRFKKFGQGRFAERAGPATINMDFSYLRVVIDHAAISHRVSDVLENLRLARKVLSKLGLIGKSKERNRRPTRIELESLLVYFAANADQKIPMHRIIPFAVATGLRQGEICRVEWGNYQSDDRTLFVPKRKHPRERETNDHLMPLVSTTGYDPFALMEEQGAETGKVGRIFPFNGKSVGTAFRRVCKELGIVDLHFHDLRHECISRLFEADWDIPQVASVSGHKDWNMLQRYTHLRPSVIAAKEAQRLKRAG